MTTGCSDEKTKKEDSPAAGVSQSPEVAPTEQADKSNSDKDSNQDSDQVSDKGASDDLELEKAKNADNTKNKEYITEETAKKTALDQVQLKENQVKFSKVKLDKDNDDGVDEYEVEFYTDDMEYDVTIDAVSGAVLKVEKESRK